MSLLEPIAVNEECGMVAFIRKSERFDLLSDSTQDDLMNSNAKRYGYNVGIVYDTVEEFNRDIEDIGDREEWRYIHEDDLEREKEEREIAELRGEDYE